MHILIAGKTGQVAQSLAEVLETTDYRWVAYGRPELDLASPLTISKVFENNEFDIVVNAAAYTSVDLAESEENIATSINGIGTGLLAKCAAEVGCPILHLSTDYVFDGSHPDPYTEKEPVAPLGAYGRSKLAGELAVAEFNPHHVILRTAWVFSPFGKNFIKTMLRLATSRDEISVVADQFGSPTYAIDIAKSLLEVAKQIHALETFDTFAWGTYHLAGTEFASWADIAETALNHSARRGGPSAKVKRIPSAEFPTPAERPKNSRLNTDLLYDTLNIRLPVWSDRVRDCTERVLRDSIED